MEYDFAVGFDDYHSQLKRDTFISPTFDLEPHISLTGSSSSSLPSDHQSRVISPPENLLQTAYPLHAASHQASDVIMDIQHHDYAPQSIPSGNLGETASFYPQDSATATVVVPQSELRETLLRELAQPSEMVVQFEEAPQQQQQQQQPSPAPAAAPASPSKAAATTAAASSAPPAAGTRSGGRALARQGSLAVWGRELGADVDIEHSRAVALYVFNENPVRGLAYMFHHNLLEADFTVVAHFLYEQPGLNRGVVGEFLGSPEPYGRAVLRAFADEFDFKDAPLDQSLRLFLFSFRLPGEAQKIERVVETFARRYHHCNPGLFSHEDTAFVLAFSTIMLHTDLHNPSNPRRMTKPEFVRNNRGIDDGADIPTPYLEGIYDRIGGEEFQVCVDHTLMVEGLVNRMQGSLPDDIIAPGRVYQLELPVAELFKTGVPRFKKAATLLVFNDCIMACGKTWDDRGYVFRKLFSLAKLTVQPLDKLPHSYDLVAAGEDDNVLFRFQLTKGAEERGERAISTIRKNIKFCTDIELATKQAKELAKASATTLFPALATVAETTEA